MSITLVVFEGLIEFPVSMVLWVPDPEDYLEVQLLNGNWFLIWREEGGLTWETLGCSVTIVNWTVPVPFQFADFNGILISHQLLEDYLFAPVNSPGDGTVPGIVPPPPHPFNSSLMKLKR